MDVKLGFYWYILAVQMSQSGQLTLELPYVIIGLGPTPNFVEKLTVGVPPNIESVCNTNIFIDLKSMIAVFLE